MKLYTRQGFTLIELSIVLVIAGLLAGGIMVGRDLIRAAEIRKLHAQYLDFVTAIGTFKVKYNCLPGDCPNATDFFEAYDPGGGTCPANSTPPGPATCDGNGDGQIELSAVVIGPVREDLLLWQHLTNAALLAGSYSGAQSTVPAALFSFLLLLPGYNCPQALSQNNCWESRSDDNVSVVDDTGKNKLFTWPMYWVPPEPPGSGVITPAEALAYDQKYDDGTPAGGGIRAQREFYTGAYCTTLDGTGDYIYYLNSSQSAQRNCNLVYDMRL